MKHYLNIVLESCMAHCIYGSNDHNEEPAMTHRDEGQYRKKHPDAMHLDDAIRKTIQAAAQDGRLSCAQAFSIAEKCRKAPEEIGRAIDILEIKISKCQLGLFGYGKGAKLVKPADSITPELEEELRKAMVENGISCRQLWEIADAQRISRVEAACACEKLGVKITNCQLGAF